VPRLRPERIVGFDAGLRHLSVAHDGWRVPCPRWFRQAERKLRQANKALSRSQQGSQGRQHARLCLARIHLRTRNLRSNYLHQLTSALVDYYDGFCLETLSLKGMARTKLVGSVADAALGELSRQLRYKADWQRKPFVQIDRWYPSSKTCSGPVTCTPTRMARRCGNSPAPCAGRPSKPPCWTKAETACS
jgi:putative transposase